jgi:hypothetical protein
VSRGKTFERIECRTKIAVDPHFRFRVPLAARLRAPLGPGVAGARYFEVPSDEFFERHGARFAPFDAVLVDGLHTADQAFRDVVHAADVLSPLGVIVMHDCNPQSAPAAAGTLDAAMAMDGYTGEWNGDVFQAIVRVRALRPDLEAFVLDCDQGLGIVRPRAATSGVAETVAGRTWDEASIASLGYDDLSRDRVALLDLRDPSALDPVLDEIGAAA